jgi:AraC-like DNA-binding protein
MSILEYAFHTRFRAMTAHASQLTPRANPAAPVQRQPASTVRAFADALARLGFDVDRLLEEAGVRRGELGDPDAQVPCATTATMISRAATERRMPNLAARMGAVTPIGAYPLLDYLIVTSDTVAQALEQLVRFFHITDAPLTWRMVHDGDVVRMVVEPGSDRIGTEYTLSIGLHHLRDETEGRLHVACVSLMFVPEDQRDLEQLFGCSIEAPSTWSGFELGREMLDVPLRRRDPALRSVLEDHAATVVASREGLSVNDDRLTSTMVRAILVSSLASGVPSIRVVSRQLNMAPRTLQRRLSAEGLSYEELADDVRRGTAERLLADAALSVGEIGYLLGFSEPSAFHRAFKRWHDETPREYRQRVSSVQSS